MSEYDDLVERLAKTLCNNMAISDDAKRMCWEHEPTRAELFKCARATLSEIHAAGLRIVPEKPTEAMLAAELPFLGKVSGYLDDWDATDVWSALLSASPYAPKDK
jgi:hypothetical protein